MDVHLVDEFVEVVFVPLTEVDERLDGLVGVGGYVLPLGFFDHGEHVICEHREVGDAIVDVGGFVDADQGFVEDAEEVAEKLKCYGLVGHLVSKMHTPKGGYRQGTSSMMLSIMALSRCLV